jgi:hypothetical protein
MPRCRQKRAWRKTVGGYGHTVIVEERSPGSVLYLRWWDRSAAGKRNNGKTGNWRKRSLGHRDKELGEEQGKELAGRLLTSQEAAAGGRITLGELFARYEADVSAHKKGSQPREDRRRIELWTQVLGAKSDPEKITKGQITRFERLRRQGRIQLPERRLGANPSETTIGADIIFLASVLNSAVEENLLPKNPIRGYDRPKTAKPRRPVATYDRYERTRAKADEAGDQGLFGPFLDLVEVLGWRVSAICQLWVSDIERSTSATAPHGRIRKRGEVDKEGVEMWVPMSEEARSALEQVQERNPAIGDTPLFRAPQGRKGRRRPKGWSRWHARDLHERAQRAAGYGYSCPKCETDLGNEQRECPNEECGHVDRLPRDSAKKLLGFHAYRRKWATERKHLPAKDVAAAGGWLDTRSLEQCYQQVDEATLLQVVSEPRKLRETIPETIPAASGKQ